MKSFAFSTRNLFLLSVLVVFVAAFLRLWKLDSVPPSLYWEEAALGYDAYSILKTGKDHHGNSWPIVAFPSFGDYKPSGYFYVLVPFIAGFGLTETAVRLPSALAGIFMVVGVGFLSRFVAERVWVKRSQSFFQVAQVLGMAVAAISPWFIQFSRGGWEVNLASCLLLWSVVVGLWVSRSDKHRFLKMMLCVVLAALSMYTYHATRVIAPALILGLLCVWISEFVVNTKNTWVSIRPLFAVLVILGVLISPLLLSSGSSQQRFAETSLFSDGTYVTDSNTFREIAGNDILSRVFTHRYLIASQQVIANFLTHFSPQFLFVSGDQNLRHSIGFMGIFYPLDALWLVVGAFCCATAIWKNAKARALILFLLWWMVIGIFPAAITKAAPHALRILPTAPVFLTVVTLGVLCFGLWLKELKPKYFFSLGVMTLLVISFGQLFVYWRYYTRIYPALTAGEWQYGYKQMVTEVEKLRTEKPERPVFITREYGRPAMYYWFFTQTDPKVVQSEESSAKKDQSEFVTFQNISFVNSVNEAKQGLVVSSPEQFSELQKLFSSVEQVGEVRDLRGQLVWVLAVTDGPPPAK